MRKKNNRNINQENNLSDWKLREENFEKKDEKILKQYEVNSEFSKKNNNVKSDFDEKTANNKIEKTLEEIESIKPKNQVTKLANLKDTQLIVLVMLFAIAILATFAWFFAAREYLLLFFSVSTGRGELLGFIYSCAIYFVVFLPFLWVVMMLKIAKKIAFWRYSIITLVGLLLIIYPVLGVYFA